MCDTVIGMLLAFVLGEQKYLKYKSIVSLCAGKSVGGNGFFFCLVIEMSFHTQLLLKPQEECYFSAAVDHSWMILLITKCQTDEEAIKMVVDGLTNS